MVPISGVIKNLSSPNAPYNNMMQGTRSVYASFAGHIICVSGLYFFVNQYSNGRPQNTHCLFDERQVKTTCGRYCRGAFEVLHLAFVFSPPRPMDFENTI
jgi:hypothetical protein